MTIYLDNAATSFPKAPGLGAAVADFIENNSRSVGRGGSDASEKMTAETRRLVCSLLHFDAAERVIFTSGATMSVNMLLRGLLRSGDHVVTTQMEHHAVLRPLYLLDGVDVTVVPAAADGRVDADALEAAVRPETRLIILSHASNVCGTVLPVREAAEIARRHGAYIAIDCAQTAGVLDIDAKEFDFVAFAGHKGLMGPQGIGGFTLSAPLAQELRPHFAGGTGTYSHLHEMPPELPSRFEPGTPNLPGIAGLRHSLRFILGEGTQKIQARETELTRRLLDGLRELPVTVHGIGDTKYIGDTKHRTSVISFTSPYSDNRVLAQVLEKNGVELRFGLHCAPSAHEALGTRETGTIRISPGYFTAGEEIDEFVSLLGRLL